jgi:hypothetical protein
MRTIFIAYNGPSPTTSPQALFAIPVAITTLQQVATPTTQSILILEWGFSLDTPASAAKVQMELIQTDVAAGSAASLTPTVWGDPNSPASLCVGGAALTMYNDGTITEGTTTAARVFDSIVVVPPFVYSKQYPLGREPEMPISKFLRVRATPTVAVNGYSYIIWEE